MRSEEYAETLPIVADAAEGRSIIAASDGVIKWH
jgi:hypothetical protein